MEWYLLRVNPLSSLPGGVECSNPICHMDAEVAVVRADPFPPVALRYQPYRAWLFCLRCGESWYRQRISATRITASPSLVPSPN